MGEGLRNGRVICIDSTALLLFDCKGVIVEIIMWECWHGSTLWRLEYDDIHWYRLLSGVVVRALALQK